MSISIGAEIGTRSAAVQDKEAEGARIGKLAQSLGLTLEAATFPGEGEALEVHFSTDEDPTTLMPRLPGMLEQLVGGLHDTPWLVGIDDAQGSPIASFARSPETAGATSWIRPNLRALAEDN